MVGVKKKCQCKLTRKKTEQCKPLKDNKGLVNKRVSPKKIFPSDHWKNKKEKLRTKWLVL